MNDYIGKNEALNLIMHNDKVCHYADKRYENVVYATAQTICKVVADMPAADVQPLSVVAEHIKYRLYERLYETAFNSTKVLESDVIADMVERIDFWIDELKEGDTK